MGQDTGQGPAFEPKPLEDIFAQGRGEAAPMEPSGQPEPEAQPTETASETGEPEQAEQPRDEAGRFAAKQQETAPPAAEDDPKERGLHSALAAERKKRQEAERAQQELAKRIAEIEARFAQQPPAPQQPPPQQPQPQAPALDELLFQDPRAFVQTLQHQMNEQLIQTRISTSFQALAHRDDFKEAVAALDEYAAQGGDAAKQEIAQNLRNQPQPGLWVLEVGKALKAQRSWAPVMQQHPDPEAYIKAEVERRIAEQRAANPVPANVPRLPTSLADGRPAAPRSSAPAWDGPRPLSAIFGGR